MKRKVQFLQALQDRAPVTMEQFAASMVLNARERAIVEALRRLIAEWCNLSPEMLCPQDATKDICALLKEWDEMTLVLRLEEHLGCMFKVDVLPPISDVRLFFIPLQRGPLNFGKWCEATAHLLASHEIRD